MTGRSLNVAAADSVGGSKSGNQSMTFTTSAGATVATVATAMAAASLTNETTTSAQGPPTSGQSQNPVMPQQTPAVSQADTPVEQIDMPPPMAAVSYQPNQMVSLSNQVMAPQHMPILEKIVDNSQVCNLL